MRTAAQWMDHYDPAWGDVCGEQPVLTESMIKAIQRDVLQHAIDRAAKAGQHMEQDDPATGDPWEGGPERAEGAYAVAQRLDLDLQEIV